MPPKSLRSPKETLETPLIGTGEKKGPCPLRLLRKGQSLSSTSARAYLSEDQLGTDPKKPRGRRISPQRGIWPTSAAPAIRCFTRHRDRPVRILRVRALCLWPFSVAANYDNDPTFGWAHRRAHQITRSIGTDPENAAYAGRRSTWLESRHHTGSRIAVRCRMGDRQKKMGAECAGACSNRVSVGTAGDRGRCVESGSGRLVDSPGRGAPEPT